MNPALGYNRSQNWSLGRPTVADSAKPVLAQEAVLKRSSDDAPDTLVVIYSEDISDKARLLATPVMLHLRNTANPAGPQKLTPGLERAGVVEPVDGGYYKVTYKIDADAFAGNPFPTTGDSVNIVADAGVEDREPTPNVQNEENRKVPLIIQRGAIKWDVKVKNNPFKSGSPGRTAVVELSPGVKNGKVKIYYTIWLYDNTGNLVLVDDRREKPVESKVEWKWDGYNGKGRLSGTGTYLFRARCEVEVFDNNDQPEKDDKGRTIRTPPQRFERSIGFVR
jgi:hypothetical protein